MISLPLNFKEWIDSHRHLLKPPVGNKLVWKNTDFIVMVVGGPNTRTDFHVNEGEEFFHQLEGDMVLQVLEDGKRRDIPIRAGEIFLLPPRVPHSPQRPAGSVGLVIERQRRPGERDGLIWICRGCGEKLYEEYFEMTNIEKDLPPVFERFYGSDANCVCRKCGRKELRGA